MRVHFKCSPPLWHPHSIGSSYFLKIFRRRYVSQIIFNQSLKKLQKDNAIRLDDFEEVNYLKDEVALRLCERLNDIKRDFSNVLDLGNGLRHILNNVSNEKIKNLCICDNSGLLFKRKIVDSSGNESVNIQYKSIDHEALMEHFKENSFDAVLSNLSLHWVNDLYGALSAIEKVLKPDGVFLASVFGGDSIFELRSSIQSAEIEREGGISPRISPMIDIKDLGGLLTSAGFKMLTIDFDDIVVQYPTAFHLMNDLSRMGENNAHVKKKDYFSRQSLLATASVYKAVYGKDGYVPATFQILYMIGWKGSDATPMSKERGSGQISLKSLNI